MLIELNGFRIKENIIPKKAYLYTYLPLGEKDKNSFLGANSGLINNTYIYKGSMEKLNLDFSFVDTIYAFTKLNISVLKVFYNFI